MSQSTSYSKLNHSVTIFDTGRFADIFDLITFKNRTPVTKFLNNTYLLVIALKSVQPFRLISN